MGTTILRVAKVKSLTNVRQAGAHQYRHHAETPNADPAKKSRNIKVIGSENLGKDVQARLNDLTKAPRKNAVLAIDGLITLSPELLKTNENLNAWANRTRDWLKNRFGDNLVNAVIHMDESSPHMHFTVVPLDEKPDGRRTLNARDMFDRWQLADMQKSYNQAMQRYIPEIEAPQYGSKATHTTIKQFYNELQAVRAGMNKEAKAMLGEMRSDAIETLEERLMPLMIRRLASIEEKFGQRLEGEVRRRLTDDYKRELREEIINAFEANATLKGLEERWQIQVEQFSPQKASNPPKIGPKP
jgi:hypothetical protein